MNPETLSEWDNVKVRILSIAGALTHCVVEEKTYKIESYQTFVTQKDVTKSYIKLRSKDPEKMANSCTETETAASMGAETQTP